MLAVLIAAGVLATPLLAGDPNACDEPGDVPDVMVSDLHQSWCWGSVGGISAYSIGTTACNVGTCWLSWIDTTPEHPVIAQNMFRLKDGRFEQIGQSWVKHAFSSASLDLCFDDCVESDGDHLGVHCSDPYSFVLNGQQVRLGPKSEINPTTGVFPYPPTSAPPIQTVIDRRLQVHDADVDPVLNVGARYYIEGQYVTADDGPRGNNASYRRIAIGNPDPGVFTATPSQQTVEGLPAIHGWVEADPLVWLTEITSSGDGTYRLAARALQRPGGVWRYEYALHNLDSHRAARAFTLDLPLGLALSSVGFHDVDYHGGEPYDGTDWSPVASGGALVWSTATHALDPQSNALRWGTLYNFRFEADAPPALRPAEIGLFLPGAPDALLVSTIGPRLCNADGTCDAAEDCDNCPADCLMGLPDRDRDSVGACDCDDGDGEIWTTPGEVLDLRVTAPDQLVWSPPAEPGALALDYEILQSPTATGFASLAVCVSDPTPEDTFGEILALPAPGQVLFYLVRAVNACAAGQGPLGANSGGGPRAGIDCPD